MQVNKSLSRTKTTPLAVPRTLRQQDITLLTSMPAGKMVPLAAIPLLREDAASGRVRVQMEMMETAEVLMNAVNLNVKAYLVPFLAFERFNGVDQLNRSYKGEPETEGGDVIPFFETMNFGASANAIHKSMGLHAAPNSLVNSAYVEAYNLIWNFRAANRSPDITKRTRLQEDLAPAFWQHSRYNHIVPNFDQAKIDGEVALNVTNAKMPVRGLGRLSSDSTWNGVSGEARDSTGEVMTGNKQALTSGTFVASSHPAPVGAGTVMDVWAELRNDGITVSLSNIELARKTQAFAKLREQFTGHDDDWIIDLLMDGITMPDRAWQQPILLDDKVTIVGMAKRYATDSGNLTESVVSGITGIDLAIRVPQCPVGGIIMIVAEVTPEQLFERQKDTLLHTLTAEELPAYLRDELDPEKVEAVRNDYVDVDHDTPDGVFGYAPLNYRWAFTGPKVGNRFYRPQVDAGFDEDRMRIWAVETPNPTLSEDFYLCTTMHTKPFVVTNQDPFEIVMRGSIGVNGLTVFGAHLVEASTDYADVLAKAPQERLDRDATTVE